jgi:hypothetical protein
LTPNLLKASGRSAIRHRRPAGPFETMSLQNGPICFQVHSRKKYAELRSLCTRNRAFTPQRCNRGDSYKCRCLGLWRFSTGNAFALDDQAKVIQIHSYGGGCRRIHRFAFCIVRAVCIGAVHLHRRPAQQSTHYRAQDSLLDGSHRLRRAHNRSSLCPSHTKGSGLYVRFKSGYNKRLSISLEFVSLEAFTVALNTTLYTHRER